ncbi:hypothetical protein GCM10010156_49030 [Planobispora rosea]|uniref:Uncharacterized protein n=1 Tax=Planobispora rosea TaxID=35762 RepID=A0A8J3S406_PLARO|nr:hypothetical protein [Planobispora rosea]GGS84594.1 hypothetical protein GCM10010156_49030 [Planobispora rosea]GIH86414.1 hypothetical protein Pro02_48220 [Planobispora rosea]
MTTPTLAALTALIGPAASDELIEQLAQSVRDRAAHAHPPSGADLHCLNLAASMGERMGPVLVRLRDAEAGHEEDEPVCRICGCSENRACEGGCAWVPNPLGVDVCSACTYAITATVMAEEDLIILERPTELGITADDGEDLLALTLGKIRFSLPETVDLTPDEARIWAAQLAAMAEASEAAQSGTYR